MSVIDKSQLGRPFFAASFPGSVASIPFRLIVSPAQGLNFRGWHGVYIELSDCTPVNLELNLRLLAWPVLNLNIRASLIMQDCSFRVLFFLKLKTIHQT